MEPVRNKADFNLNGSADNAHRAFVGFHSFRVEQRLSVTEYSVRSGGKTLTVLSDVPLEPGSVARGRFLRRGEKLYVELAPKPAQALSLESALGLKDDALTRIIVRTFRDLGLHLERKDLIRARNIAEKSGVPEDAVLVLAVSKANGIELPEEAVLGIAFRQDSDRSSHDWSGDDGLTKDDEPSRDGDNLAASVASALKALAKMTGNEPGLVSALNGDSASPERIILIPLGLYIGTVDFSGFLLLYYNGNDSVFRVDSSVAASISGGLPERWFCSVTGKSVTVRSSVAIPEHDRAELETRLRFGGFCLNGSEPDFPFADVHA